MIIFDVSFISKHFFIPWLLYCIVLNENQYLPELHIIYSICVFMRLSFIYLSLE